MKAQVIGYFQDVKTLPNQPFVVVSGFGQGFRIEVENPSGEIGTCLVDLTIYRLRKTWGYKEGWLTLKDAKALCHRLNNMVKDGKIVRKPNGLWIYPPLDN